MTWNIFKYIKFLKATADEIDEKSAMVDKILTGNKKMLLGDDEWFYGNLEINDGSGENLDLECTCKRKNSDAE